MEMLEAITKSISENNEAVERDLSIRKEKRLHSEKVKSSKVD